MSTESVALSREAPFPLVAEQRYPLDLAIRIPELRRLYHESNAAIWDVEKDLATEALAIGNTDAATRAAAALLWSRRAWLFFSDISESEAALVRCCLETEREADLKFVLAARGTERAVAADACHQIARALNGYIAGPPGDLGMIFAAEPIRRALDQRVDFDAYVVAHFVVLASIDRALHEVAIETTSEPTCRRALERILVDLRRQELAGRIYAATRIPKRDSDSRDAVMANVVDVVRLDILGGRRCTAFLDDDIDGASTLRDAEERTAVSGLGAAPLQAQHDAVKAALAALRTDLDRLGLDGGVVETILA